jgi:hypothetical protein
VWRAGAWAGDRAALAAKIMPQELDSPLCAMEKEKEGKDKEKDQENGGQEGP